MRKVMLLLTFCGLVDLLFLMPPSSVAQTKASGTLDCSKLDPIHEIKVPEQAGFSYIIGQSKCVWPKSYTVEGLQSTHNNGVEFDEVMGTSGRYTVTGYTQYNNGDRAYHKTTGTFDTKKLLSSGKWTYTHGTGRLRGIKGSGTTECKIKSADADAGAICEVKGEYTLPDAKK